MRFENGKGVTVLFLSLREKASDKPLFSNSYKMKTSSRPSYIGLINRFWRLHSTIGFTPAETSLYFYLLNVANTALWPDDFSHADAMIMAALGISRNTLRTARESLAKAELIDFIPGGNGRGNRAIYTFTGCLNCEENPKESCQDMCHKNDAELTPKKSPKQESDYKTDASSEVNARILTPNTQYTRACEEKTRQEKTKSSSLQSDGGSLSSSQNGNTNAITELEAPALPDDGVARNYEGLCRRLITLKASKYNAYRIIKNSNFGEIGHKVWALLAEVQNSGGKIQQPVNFILSRLTA